MMSQKVNKDKTTKIIRNSNANEIIRARLRTQDGPVMNVRIVEWNRRRPFYVEDLDKSLTPDEFSAAFELIQESKEG